MRKHITFTIIFVLLFFTACSNYREQDIKALQGVKLYTAMNDDTVYKEKVFSGEDAKSIADLVKSECPQNVGETFVRVTLESRASTLILYTDETGKNVTCTVLKPKEQRTIDVKPQSAAPEKETALVVNGQKITVAQIQTALAALPADTTKDANTIGLVVNRIINDELVRQEAQKIEVSASEIAKSRAAILAQANISEEKLVENLKSQGKTMDEFDAAVKDQTRTAALLKKRLLLDDSNVTEEDARTYYLTNPNQFLQTEQALMRHIFIASQGRTTEEVRSRVQQVVNRLNTTDFCILVKDYSDDTQNQDRCGAYLVPRGVVDPNLELASFSTPANQTAIIEVQGGVHFVQHLQTTPAQVVPYTQIAATLQDSLRNNIVQQRLNLYIATLRSQADITSYLG